MHHALGAYLTVGAVVVALHSPGPLTQPADTARAIQLTSVDTLGSGTAFVMGGSTIPIPSPGYLDAVNTVYLQPRGFTGTVQGLFTPEGLYPLSGVKSLPTDTSFAQGAQILTSTIVSQLAGGQVSADNPVVVLGWSQSATVSSLAMPQLQAAGVPSDAVHFVLLGNPSAPNGGMLERFNVPIDGHSLTVPALGITFSGAAPPDLYPTDMYTTEYDGFANFPRYPLNFLSDLNAIIGILTAHTAYASYTPEELAAMAVALPTSEADSLTNYYMIPTETLPLLLPLQFLPVIGQPLYDLLEPVTRILVNLGYGNIEHGWDPGPADVPTTFGLFPTELDWGEVVDALANGVSQGFAAAVADLQHPQPSSDNAVLTMLVGLLHTLGFTDATEPGQLSDPAAVAEMWRNMLGGLVNFPISDVSLFSSSPVEIVNALSGTLAADYAALLPITDTVNTLLTTVPGMLAGLAAERLADGDLLGAIGDPLAAATALIPFALTFGVLGPLSEVAGGTLLNLADLVDLS